ncbi:membrane or secreted protein [Pseudoflavitalea sp. X16]|uniref:membrane or secreted protein n=1 Tax=Paraflavitalea devenefica TaxID=2716334 RepID=UPI00142453BF|nr:membrane or secreted protein [Paraflavitalea devenefica]NII25722.1 membrane or secreted protein [Paraflavitalea devenefica]
MRKYAPANNFIITLLILIVVTAFHPPVSNLSLTGAWHYQEGTHEETLTFVDGYFVQAVFDKTGKQFMYTWGGPYAIKDDKIEVTTQFHTQQREKVGEVVSIAWSDNNGQLVANVDGKEKTWTQTDKGMGDLAGVWRIAGRKQQGQPVTMPLRPRRTLKILSATRFQWVAINIETKEFSGTGGGTYTFKNGKYTENIEFFSRDSTRVGASLTFNGKVRGNEWDHTGLSSKGDPIDEMWKKLNAE